MFSIHEIEGVVFKTDFDDNTFFDKSLDGSVECTF